MRDDRRQKLITNLVAGMSKSDAARAAGYSPSFCRVNVYTLTKSAEFQQELAQARTASNPSSAKSSQLTSAVPSHHSATVSPTNEQGACATPSDGFTELTVKQLRFKDAYLNEAAGNGTRAAKLAGYEGDDRTLSAIASENLRKPNIRAAIRRELEIMTGRDVLTELTSIAQADWKNFLQVQYGDDGEVIAAKLHLKDKVKALELLGKYHQLFRDPETGPHSTTTIIVAGMSDADRKLRLAELIAKVSARQEAIDIEGRVIEQGSALLLPSTAAVE